MNYPTMKEIYEYLLSMGTFKSSKEIAEALDAPYEHVFTRVGGLRQQRRLNACSTRQGNKYAAKGNLNWLISKLK